jgi:D-isomer specific 2-hydroxyacid dehydrogenase, catalytic domain
MRYRSGAQRERRARPDSPLRVIVGRERFSEQHGWSEMPRLWPAGLASRVAIEAIQDGRLEERLTWGGPSADVVVPVTSSLPGEAIRAGAFGLIQQFGAGVDNIDLDAAAAEGVWVANMHNAALTSDYFQAASRRLGDALTRYLRHEPPADLVTRE